jgi:hypothetical protein
MTWEGFEMIAELENHEISPSGRNDRESRRVSCFSFFGELVAWQGICINKGDMVI